MKLLPFIVIVVLLVGLMLFSSRNKRRQFARQQAQSDAMAVGTRVMTTSGLYGTVAAKNEDGTVQLTVAPGLDLTWELAAVRDVASLPGRADRPGAGYAGGPPPGATTPTAAGDDGTVGTVPPSVPGASTEPVPAAWAAPVSPTADVDLHKDSDATADDAAGRS